MRIEKDAQEQTITFQLPQLPGEVFRITIPEIISDTQDVIVPWSQTSPNWEIGEDSARWSAQVPEVFRMAAEVLFRGERILASVRLTNLSGRAWRQANVFTCFAYWQAPSFDDPQLARTFLTVGEGWRSVGQLFAQHNPGDGPYTFFPVQGGPAPDELWLCRKIPQWHPQMVSRGCACVVSADGEWVAGMATDSPAYVFVNRVKRCVHADPLLPAVGPGETVEASSTIHILGGGVAEFARQCEYTA